MSSEAHGTQAPSTTFRVPRSAPNFHAPQAADAYGARFRSIGIQAVAAAAAQISTRGKTKADAREVIPVLVDLDAA